MKINKFWMFLYSMALVALGGSIALNVLLYNQAKKYYFELNETRLDPVGINYYLTPSGKATDTRSNTQSNTQPVRVVFFGDSRAANWTAPNLSGYEFINRGIGSQTSVQTIARFSAHVQPLKPDVVVIQVCINDLKTIALFPDRQEAIISTCQANIKRMVDETKRLGAVAIVTTVFPAGEVPLARKPFWSDAIGQGVKDVNAYIATLADDRTIVFDAYTVLADSKGLMAQQYEKDELHLNQQGYVALNQQLERLLPTLKLRAPKQ